MSGILMRKREHYNFQCRTSLATSGRAEKGKPTEMPGAMDIGFGLTVAVAVRSAGLP
jgi:hypothetical protein